MVVLTLPRLLIDTGIDAPPAPPDMNSPPLHFFTRLEMWLWCCPQLVCKRKPELPYGPTLALSTRSCYQRPQDLTPTIPTNTQIRKQMSVRKWVDVGPDGEDEVPGEQWALKMCNRAVEQHEPMDNPHGVSNRLRKAGLVGLLPNRSPTYFVGELDTSQKLARVFCCSPRTRC